MNLSSDEKKDLENAIAELSSDHPNADPLDLPLPVQMPVDNVSDAVYLIGGREYQEDRVFSARKDHFDIICVFDGHGSWHAAEAARIYVAATYGELISSYATNVAKPELFQQYFREIEKFIIEYETYMAIGDNKGETGCTCTIVILDNKTGRCSVANVGDSSVVELSKSSNFERSVDHTPSVDVNESEYRRVRSHPEYTEKSVNDDARLGGLNMSRVLGDTKAKYKNGSMQDNGLRIEPHLSTFILDPSSVLVVASDGLWEKLNKSSFVVSDLQNVSELNFGDNTSFIIVKRRK